MLVLVMLRTRPRYGYEINKELELLSHGRLIFQAGTLYPILHKLERKELITSAWEHLPDERPRRIYVLTDKGRTEVDRQVKEWVDFATAVGNVIEGTGGAEPA